MASLEPQEIIREIPQIWRRLKPGVLVSVYQLTLGMGRPDLWCVPISEA